MAAVDKYYTGSYDEYKALIDWAKDKSFCTPRGNHIFVSNYIIDWWDKSDFDNNEHPILDTPKYVDNYLYHNCPLTFIKEWLENSYCGIGYCKGCPSNIKEELSIPNYEVAGKIKVIKRGYSNHHYSFHSKRYNGMKCGCFDVSIRDANNHSLWYNSNKDYWITGREMDVWTSSHYHTHSSVKSIIRKTLKKWKLPKNCEIVISGDFVGDEWILKTC